LVYPWCCRTDSLSLFVVFVSPGCSLSARSLFSGCLLRRLPQARGGGSGVSNCFIGGSVRRSAGCHVGQAIVCYVGGWQWIVGLACLFFAVFGEPLASMAGCISWSRATGPGCCNLRKSVGSC
jgi:hypothetical protein